MRLFKTRTAALLNTEPIDLTLAGVTGTEHRLVKVVDAYQPAQATIDPRLDVNGDDNHIRIDASRMGVTTGDTIVYGNNGDDETIGDVVDGGTYYVHVYTDAQDHPISMTLHTTRADALTVPAFGFNPDDPAIDDGPANTIKLGGSNSGFSTGDKVTYATGGGAYWWIDRRRRLFSTHHSAGANFFASFFNTAHDAANNTNAIALNIPPATGNPHTITSLNGRNVINLTAAGDTDVLHSLTPAQFVNPATAVDSNADTIDFGDFRTLHDGDAVIYRNGGGQHRRSGGRHGLLRRGRCR